MGNRTCRRNAAKWFLSAAIFGLSAALSLPLFGITIHRSFRTREAGVGFGTGTAGVAYPVDAKIDKAIDEARQKEDEKVKGIIGRCTKVSDGDTIHVITDGNVKFKVRLDRIDAPEKDQPYGNESTTYLSSLIRGKTVRVEWQKKDRYGRVLGIVYLDKTEINFKLVATGNAWHYAHFDHASAYAAAKAAAKEKKLGLWASDNVIPRISDA